MRLPVLLLSAPLYLVTATPLDEKKRRLFDFNAVAKGIQAGVAQEAPDLTKALGTPGLEDTLAKNTQGVMDSVGAALKSNEAQKIAEAGVAQEAPDLTKALETPGLEHTLAKNTQDVVDKVGAALKSNEAQKIAEAFVAKEPDLKEKLERGEPGLQKEITKDGADVLSSVGINGQDARDAASAVGKALANVSKCASKVEIAISQMQKCSTARVCDCLAVFKNSLAGCVEDAEMALATSALPGLEACVGSVPGSTGTTRSHSQTNKGSRSSCSTTLEIRSTSRMTARPTVALALQGDPYWRRAGFS
eukprot:TRINITY_DN19300_c0_g1_i11.p1 TRINITY_DN19300_c0_g1~~TRINITY_DN19300_c0_g1_i11.p1  ORF type:complete len:305 (+),score=79.94 TRINITY_DN19300_c0_g1_i11:82-996(+)